MTTTAFPCGSRNTSCENALPPTTNSARLTSKEISPSLIGELHVGQSIIQKSQPANQQLPLINHLGWQAIVQIEKELFMPQDFLAPGSAIKGLQRCKLIFREIQSLPFDVVVVRRPADGRLFAE